MNINGSVPVATIAAEMPDARGLFESLGIDYACGGQRSLQDAAHAEGLDAEVVIAGLRRMTGGNTETWNEKPLRDLIRHLVQEHHHFVRDELMSLALWLADVCSPPVRTTAELQSLRSQFTRLADLLLPHLHDEEIVFTGIEALENSWQANEPLHPEDDLRGRIQRLIADHGVLSGQLRAIRELRLRLMTVNNLPLRTRRALDAVAMLEAHLHEYMFLENCMLFPRAIALDRQIAAA